MTSAASDLPTTMMPSVASTCSGSRSRMLGSNSMPTETKNSTAKASRSGSVSCAASCDSSDSLSTMPAKNAPSAKLTPNSAAEPKATPSAIDSTVSREQLVRSAERDAAEHFRNHPAADHQHQRDEGGDFAERQRNRSEQLQAS
jgi:hypothetical protein